MKSIALLDQFIGKTVTDISEHKENDPIKNNETYIQVSFDDDTWIRFPLNEEWFWYNLGD